jgi:hypothetical protein
VSWRFTGIQKKAFSLEGDQFIHLNDSKLGHGDIPHQGTHTRWGDFVIRGFLKLFYRKDNTGPNNVYFEEDVTDAAGTRFVHVEESDEGSGLYSGKLYVADASKTKVIKDINATLAYLAAIMLERVSETIGDGTSTSFTITHNFGTRDVSVEVRETSGNYYSVITPVAFNEDTVVVTFANPPSTNEYRVTVIG